MNKFLKNIIIFIVFLLFGCCLSILIGVEKIPYDVWTYHLYSAHAFIHNTVEKNLFLGGIFSYINPYIELPYYFLIKYFNNNTYFVTFLMGNGYGIYLFILYKLYQSFITQKNSKIYKYFMILTMFLGATGTIAIINLGTTYNDNIPVGLLFIAMFIIFKTKFFKNNSKISMFICGLILGLSCAIKIQYSLYSVALILSLLCFKNEMKNPYKTLAIIILGAICSFLTYNTYWYIRIWKLWGNPIFPFANNIFNSAYSVPIFVDKEPFQFPETFLQTIFYPFYLIFNQHDGHREIRLPVLMTIIVSYSVFIIPFKNRLSKQFKILNRFFNLKYFNFSILFIIFSYLIWLFMIPCSRYILPLESLCGAILFIFLFLLSLIYKKRTFFITITAIIFLSIALFSKTDLTLGSRMPIPKDHLIYFEDMKIEDNALVILDYFQWTPSGVVVFQNPKAKYITYPFLNPGNEKNNPKQNLPAFAPLLKQQIEEAYNKTIYVISFKEKITNEFDIFLNNHEKTSTQRQIKTNMPNKLYIYKYNCNKKI